MKVTERKTAHNFARCMYDLARVHCREAETVRVVLDNLSAHKPTAPYEVYGPKIARQVFRRLRIHFVPKHTSWFNMAKIEIGVLANSVCTGASPTATRYTVNWQAGNADETPGEPRSSGYSTFAAPARSSPPSTSSRSAMNSFMPSETVKTSVQRY